MHDAGQGERQKRGVLRAFPHAGVAAHDGGDHLPKRDGRREVAGVDDTANTQRAAVGEQLLVWKFRIDGLAVQSATFGLKEQTRVNGFLDFPARFLEGLADFTCLQSDKRLFVFHQQSAHVSDDLTSGWGRRRSPGRKSSSGGMECLANIVSC